MSIISISARKMKLFR